MSDKTRPAWWLPGWDDDAPDHWSREVDERWTLSSWESAAPGFTWEIWDLVSSPDEPLQTGPADSLADAVKRAEDAWSRFPGNKTAAIEDAITKHEGSYAEGYAAALRIVETYSQSLDRIADPCCGETCDEVLEALKKGQRR